MSPAMDLTRDYPCTLGAPVLRAVDPAIFSLRYFRHCMACGFCRDACCNHGVDIDLANAARLRAAPGLEEYVGAPASAWFSGEAAADAEFPSGSHLRTAAPDGACIFLDRRSRGCRIHSYCLERGIDYHDLKPLVSVLFPVTFEHGVLVASGEAADGSLVCAGTGETLYEGARGELAHYFGEGLVAELDAMRNANTALNQQRP